MEIRKVATTVVTPLFDSGTSRNFMHENPETSETPAVPTDGRSAGEGLGRTARVYVYEESHCGVVPMNHSNKDKQSSAESGEGKAAAQGEHSSPDTYPTPSGIARVPRVGESRTSEKYGRH